MVGSLTATTSAFSQQCGFCLCNKTATDGSQLLMERQQTVEGCKVPQAGSRADFQRQSRFWLFLHQNETTKANLRVMEESSPVQLCHPSTARNCRRGFTETTPVTRPTTFHTNQGIYEQSHNVVITGRATKPKGSWQNLTESEGLSSRPASTGFGWTRNPIQLI